jgi:hypothetical protein
VRGDDVKGTREAVEREGPARGVSPEAVAFMMDIGICPGNDCPYAVGRCDPRCPALVAWVEQVMDG